MRVRLSLYFYTLVVVMLAAAPPRVELKPGIDKELLPYFITFEDLGKHYINSKFVMPDINASIDPRFNAQQFEDAESGVLGWCWMDHVPRELIVSKSFWDTATPTERELVVLHELGHCALHREHLNNKDEFGRPVSIMYWQLFPTSTYNDRRDYYLKELFTKKRD